MADLPDLSGHQVYACGAPVMVDSAQRDFVARCGLPADEFYADSFTSEADKHGARRREPPRRTRACAALRRAGAARARAGRKPIRLIVPYPPGGPLDIVARALADKVKDSLGTVIVENRPGAGGNLGADLVAKAAPDGTTIVMGAVATHAINPWLYSEDAVRPAARLHADHRRGAGAQRAGDERRDGATRLGINSVADLVAYAKKPTPAS